MSSPTHSPATIVVIDAGGRYGIHPSWKDCRADLDYHLFEPDPLEAERLAKKYAGKPSVQVRAQGLSDREQTITLSILKNPAMSTSCQREAVSPLFADQRKDQEEVVRRIAVPCTTIDRYCAQQGLKDKKQLLGDTHRTLPARRNPGGTAHESLYHSADTE